jgi:hypothetical protein
LIFDSELISISIVLDEQSQSILDIGNWSEIRVISDKIRGKKLGV